MTAEGNDWFIYTFETAEVASLIFNDGAGRQTGNLRRERLGWFYTNNQWYDESPERPRIPVISASPPARIYLTPQRVELEGSNRDDAIYYTTDGTTPTSSSSVYAAPIEITQPTTLMAFGVNSAGDAGGISTFDTGGEFIWVVHAAPWRVANRERRVGAMGVPANHSPTRIRLIATAVTRCCRWVLANPR